MRELIGNSIILALVAITVYLYWSEGEDFFAPPKPEAPIAPVDPAAKANIDEELDYLTAKRIGSLEGWQAFLTAHGSGLYAQSARAELEKLLHTEKTPTSSATEVSNSVSPGVTAAIEAQRPAAPSPTPEVASSTPDEICKHDEERLDRLRNSRSSDEAARFADELGCEKLRPQLLGLMETLGSSAPAPAAAEVSNGASPDAKPTSKIAPLATASPAPEVASSTPDEICKRDEERLGRLRSSPSSDEVARFADELGCEKLRPQLLGLMQTLASLAPAPAAAEVSNGVSPDAKATSEVAPLAAPSPATEVASSTPDEICKRDEERLGRLRSSPSSDEVARFADELGCEKLRPQLLGLMQTLASLAPAPAAAEVSNGVSPDAKATSEVAPLAAPSPATEVASSTPDEICKRDEERLVRLRSSPSSDEVARFANELGCETLRPQLLRLMESWGSAATTPAPASQSRSVKQSSAVGLKPASDCVSERDRLDHIRSQPSADMAQQFWRDLQCERLRPQVRRLLESLNVSGDPPGPCQREAEELNRIRANPSRRDAEGFARDMTCDALKPQAARLLESVAE